MLALPAPLRAFDYVRSSDEEVAACASLLFGQLRRGAIALAGSPLAASAAAHILDRSSLPAALASLLRSKLCAADEEGAAADALEQTMENIFGSRCGLRSVTSDLLKTLRADPAVDSPTQPFLFFKGFHALAVHRVAHALWTKSVNPLSADAAAALALQSRSSERFGVDMHPAATLGDGVMLDHATAIVIGSTARVGCDVCILHGVTLGANGKPMARGARRHPTVGDRVFLGAGCTILGDITVHEGATVGAGAIVTRDVPKGATVVGVNELVARATASKL